MTIDRVNYGMGELAFRIYDRTLAAGASFNSALYDAQMVAFAETKNHVIIDAAYKPRDLRRATLRLFHDDRFLNSIRQATSDEQAVKTRIEVFRDFLDGYGNGV